MPPPLFCSLSSDLLQPFETEIDADNCSNDSDYRWDYDSQDAKDLPLSRFY